MQPTEMPQGSAVAETVLDGSLGRDPALAVDSGTRAREPVAEEDGQGIQGGIDDAPEGSLPHGGHPAGSARVPRLSSGVAETADKVAEKEEVVVMEEVPEYTSYTRSKLGNTVHYRIWNGRSLYIFSIQNPVRRFCIHFLTISSYFDLFMILTILVNCVFLALNNQYFEAE